MKLQLRWSSDAYIHKAVILVLMIIKSKLSDVNSDVAHGDHTNTDILY